MKKIYVKDFQVFTSPDEDILFPHTAFLKLLREKYGFKAEQLNFLRKVAIHNGIGPKCVIPRSILGAKYTVDDARDEARLVMFTTIEQLLKKAHVKASEIDVLVTNCSLFNPTPSLSSMIVNKFKMRSDIHSFSLGGMGCSASPIGVDVMQSFLQNHKYGLLISTENTTQNFYRGTEKSMLLTNTLFRMGAAAILFTNKKSGSKYEVVDLVRTHYGANDDAHNCIWQRTDAKNNIGVKLEKTITQHATKALEKNMTKLFKRIMPLWIVIHYVFKVIYTKFTYWYQTKIQKKEVEKPKYILPKITGYIDHFCFHTGGKAVIDTMQSIFQLNSQQIEASKAALWRYGNTSSASIWYELAYHESKGMKKNDITWQIAFGSGFKCNSLVLKALQKIKNITWFDEFDKDFKFNEEMTKGDLITKEEQQYSYEQWDQQVQEEQEKRELAEVLEKYKGKLVLVEKKE